jgi:hypothetical protein
MRSLASEQLSGFAPAKNLVLLRRRQSGFLMSLLCSSSGNAQAMRRFGIREAENCKRTAMTGFFLLRICNIHD